MDSCTTINEDVLLLPSVSSSNYKQLQTLLVHLQAAWLAMQKAAWQQSRLCCKIAMLCVCLAEVTSLSVWSMLVLRLLAAAWLICTALQSS